MEIGAKLQQFYQASRSISQISSSVTALLSGEEITSTIDGLRGISADLELAADRSRQHSGQLQNLLRMVEQVNAALSGFQRHVQELNILCFSIRVESVHLGSSESEFDTLADDIKRLAAEIEAKSKAILDSLNFLANLIRENLSRIMKIEESQRGQTKTILADTSSSLAGLVEQYEKSLATARRIAASYEELTRITGEIVFSLQFHDITRQQIEHVSETLRRAAEQQDQATEGLAEVCELQAAQIRFAGSKLFEAVGGISSNLESTSQKIGEISGQMREIAGDGEEAGASFFSKTKAPLAHACEILSKFEEEERGLMAASESISRALDEMSSFVGGIRQLGMAIRLIALNSIVKSAHVGDRGAALGIIANEIHGLSLKTGQQTREISEAFGSITSFAEQLGTRADGQKESSKQTSARAMITTIDGLQQSLSDTNQLVTSRMGEIQNAAATLIGEIERLASGIHVHERALEAINEIASRIDEVVVDLRARAPSKDGAQAGAPGQELLKQIERSYTMDSERELHHKIGSSPPAPATEEIPAPQACEPDANLAESSEEDDLGDNVELF